jgi:hypothetical protein
MRGNAGETPAVQGPARRRRYDESRIMFLDLSAFLDRFAAWMASRTSAATVYSTTPRGLWIHAAVEGMATNPYSVLAVYGGVYEWVPCGQLSIQCMSIGRPTASLGSNAAATVAMAGALFNTLLDAAGQPVRAISLTGFKIVAALNLRPPAMVGVDDAGRVRVASNFDISVVPVATA